MNPSFYQVIERSHLNHIRARTQQKKAPRFDLNVSMSKRRKLLRSQTVDPVLTILYAKKCHPSQIIEHQVSKMNNMPYPSITAMITCAIIRVKFAAGSRYNPAIVNLAHHESVSSNPIGLHRPHQHMPHLENVSQIHAGLFHPTDLTTHSNLV